MMKEPGIINLQLQSVAAQYHKPDNGSRYCFCPQRHIAKILCKTTCNVRLHMFSLLQLKENLLWGGGRDTTNKQLDWHKLSKIL